MIKSFKHKGLREFYEAGKTKGIQSQHIKRIRLILAVLNAAANIQDVMAIPTLKCHPLVGNRKGQYSVVVNGNWRITFEWVDSDVYLLNYEDYH